MFATYAQAVTENRNGLSDQQVHALQVLLKYLGMIPRNQAVLLRVRGEKPNGRTLQSLRKLGLVYYIAYETPRAAHRTTARLTAAGEALARLQKQELERAGYA